MFNKLKAFVFLRGSYSQTRPNWQIANGLLRAIVTPTGGLAQTTVQRFAYYCYMVLKLRLEAKIVRNARPRSTSHRLQVRVLKIAFEFQKARINRLEPGCFAVPLVVIICPTRDSAPNNRLQH